MRHSGVLGCCLALCLLSPAWGEQVKVRFATVPARVTVYVGLDPLGDTNQELVLDLDRYSDPVQVWLERDGYKRYLLEVPFQKLRDTLNLSENDAHLYPYPEPIRLVPLQFWRPWISSAQDHPAVALGLACLPLFGVPLVLSGLRRLRRLEAERRLTAELDPGEGSLIARPVGDFLPTEQIGQGGMGVVYRAVRRDRLNSEDTYALKVVSRDLCQEPEFRARFEREIRVLRSLSHKNIVQIYDWGEIGSRLYYVMEDVHGEALRSRIRPEGVDPAWARTVLGQIFEAVFFAHGRGVVHRDLKPENIMLVEGSDQVKVMDFGLARQVDSQTHLTQTGVAMGTPAYMAPEQIRGEVPEAGQDQYSLGMIVYELLAGSHPYKTKDVVQVMYLQIHEMPESLAVVRPGLPEPVAQVVERMLAKSRQARYRDLAEAWGALDTALGQC